ncbi:unnamed protein product [Dovyalis caffra]|uniref:Uncharacterized protein n=1 Tax=Dovyalis caffra TaxID=77055 RepID=A0AAV1SKV0_9ROSI|nr:unnamed protein product [Dovyalis caffra]
MFSVTPSMLDILNPIASFKIEIEIETISPFSGFPLSKEGCDTYTQPRSSSSIIILSHAE